MIEEIRVPPKDIPIRPEQIYDVMGYGGTLPDPEIRDLTSEVIREGLEVASPRYMYRIVEAKISGAGTITLDGKEFRVGSIITSYLEGMTHASIFVTTAGDEYDRYLQRLKAGGDILKEFVADSLGSVLAESCVDIIDRKLGVEYDCPHSLPYSPGYCAWNVKQQELFFSLFPENPCGITLTPSCLMHPVKSISGFMALGKSLTHQPYRCDICSNKTCYKRKRQ